MHPLPSLSLVISTYNRPDALAAVVEACFSQSDQNFDIIIADDGSTATTAQCVAALKARSPVPMQHVWQADDGFRLAMARNRAIDLVRADPESFADEDTMIVAPAPADPSARPMSEELRKLLACMGRLEEERRRLVLTAYYGGRSRDELAAEFHQPVAAIRSGLRRTLFDIQECLKA